MFSTIGRRLTYTNVALTLALVFAMSGGAYAAGKYLITSTKQISPKVLKQLIGKPGAPGHAGANGANGANGKDGAPGSPGEKGAAGANGTGGTNGKDGASVASATLASGNAHCKEGGSEFTAAESKKTYACNGSPWTAGGTLPKGASETGVWSQPQAVEYPTHNTQFISVPISFTVPLTAELEESDVHFIAPSEAPPSGCKGSVTSPEADSGNLCVFASAYEGILARSFINPAGGPAAASKTGILMSFELPETEEVGATAHGTWAVTG